MFPKNLENLWGNLLCSKQESISIVAEVMRHSAHELFRRPNLVTFELAEVAVSHAKFGGKALDPDSGFTPQLTQDVAELLHRDCFCGSSASCHEADLDPDQ